MANHGYITTKKNLTPDLLERLMREINQERFGGKIKIVRDGDYCCVVIFDNWSRNFWLASKRKIEHRHGGPGGDLFNWIEYVFSNDLALKLDGMESDDGVGEKWKGQPGKYPSLRSYVNEMWSSFKEETFFDRILTKYHTHRILTKAIEMRPDLKEYILGEEPAKTADPTLEEIEAFATQEGLIVHNQIDLAKFEMYDWNPQTRTWTKK